MIYLAFLWLLDRSDLGLVPFCCIVYSGLWSNYFCCRLSVISEINVLVFNFTFLVLFLKKWKEREDAKKRELSKGWNISSERRVKEIVFGLW